MNIFVTVGTTYFDSLIEAVDRQLSNDKYKVRLQISNGKYRPKNFEYFSFIDDIESEYSDADIVITHAGAGSIYKLLELGKKIIIVPNLDRLDKHQLDIANFMDDNDFAFSLYNLDELLDVVREIENREFKKYIREDFFKIDEIMNFINDQL